jgi:replication initiation protein RepC
MILLCLDFRSQGKRRRKTMYKTHHDLSAHQRKTTRQDISFEIQAGKADETSEFLSHRGMPNGQRSSGWRKATLDLAFVKKHAKIGKQAVVSKKRATVAYKKVAPAIGLKAAHTSILDILFASTQPQDWELGRRPIVWTSNNFLMERLGLSFSSLRRHIRRMCDLGVIAMKDSSNGKRWGHRDDEGYIIEAYGFDLSPLAARAEEFEALHADLEKERQLRSDLHKKLTITRRDTGSMIELAKESDLKGPWRDLENEFQGYCQVIGIRRPLNI